MKLKQQARVLKSKAQTSFITAAEAFNSPRDEGRVTKVLLHRQHAFELLLKAAPVQSGKPVFDQATGCSIGFERCNGRTSVRRPQWYEISGEGGAPAAARSRARLCGLNVGSRADQRCLHNAGSAALHEFGASRTINAFVSGFP